MSDHQERQCESASEEKDEHRSQFEPVVDGEGKILEMINKSGPNSYGQSKDQNHEKLVW